MPPSYTENIDPFPAIIGLNTTQEEVENYDHLLGDAEPTNVVPLRPSVLDQKIAVTRFPTMGAATKGEAKINLRRLAEIIAMATATSKDGLPWFKLARFGDRRTDKRSLRNNDNVVAVSGIEADYDAGIISVTEAERRMKEAGIAALIYSTPSHTDAAPRWRVFAPFSAEREPASRAGFMERLNGVFDGSLDGASFTLSQAFYAGNIAGKPPIVVRLVDGIAIDLADHLDSTALAKGKRRNDGDEVPSTDTSGSGALYQLACKCKRDGLTKAEFESAISDHPGAAAHVAKEEKSSKGRGKRATDRAWERAEGPIQFEFDDLDEDEAAARRAEQKAENQRIQDLPFSILPPAMTVEAMLADCVWIAEGSQVGRLSNPRDVLTYKEFADLTASSVSFEPLPNAGKGKDDSRRQRVPNAGKWKQHSQRRTVTSRTFHAGADVICRAPDGQTALNSWRPIRRAEPTCDIAPFLEQVTYLFPAQSERDAFMDWLAHIEQRQGELPHYGWLHIATSTGTGRNWLASVLARVWRGYVAPNVDLPALLDSQFNGQLAGRVLAIVDEVQEGAGENPYRHSNKLKSLVNAEYRDLNPKFGRQYREHNACRWLVFSNHENALPLNDTDRRWRVVRHTALPRAAKDYAKLYSLLSDAEFINAVGVHLRQRDITTFNPGERPPMNDAKRAAVNASQTLIQRYAADLVANWPTDVVTNADAARFMSDSQAEGLTPAMRRALEEVGACSVRQKTLSISKRSHRAWILRNHARWLEAGTSQLVEEAERGLYSFD